MRVLIQGMISRPLLAADTAQRCVLSRQSPTREKLALFAVAFDSKSCLDDFEKPPDLKSKSPTFCKVKRNRRNSALLWTGADTADPFIHSFIIVDFKETTDHSEEFTHICA